MSLTLQQIESEVQIRSGNDTSTSSQTIDRWVNLAVGDIAARADWPWNINTKSTDTTVNGTTEYTLPTDYKKMLSVRVGDSSSATETSATEMSFIRYEQKNTKNPNNMYYINSTNGKYGLLPTPQVTGLPIFLKYFSIPDVLVNPTDTCPWPSEYDELAILYSLARYWEVNDDLQKTNFYMVMFENLADRMKTDLMVRTTGDLGRMRDYRELISQTDPQDINPIGLGKM